MSLAIAASTALTLGISGGFSYMQGRDALKAQQASEQTALMRARQQAKAAERDFNRVNQKKPDLAAMLAGNASAASGGAGSTMLTGPQGVTMNPASLGRTSLLGG